MIIWIGKGTRGPGHKKMCGGGGSLYFLRP